MQRLEAGEQIPDVDLINQLIDVLPLSAEELLLAMGVRLQTRDVDRLPRRLIDALLALEPERLDALAVLLGGRPVR